MPQNWSLRSWIATASTVYVLTIPDSGTEHLVVDFFAEIRDIPTSTIFGEITVGIREIHDGPIDSTGDS
jgi:hypothetical protein